jgi:hypothetical protein
MLEVVRWLAIAGVFAVVREFFESWGSCGRVAR